MDVANPLEELAAQTGADFAAISEAQAKTPEAIERLAKECSSRLDLPEGCAIVAVGSLGRREVTSKSDADLLILAPDERAFGLCRGLTESLNEAVAEAGFDPPGATGLFGKPVDLEELIAKIGGDADLNKMLTRRILLLFESTPVLEEKARADGLERLLGSYLDKPPALKDRRPPRFLLNDLVRYWRTVCVDYEGKLRDEGAHKSALRNAKLRFSRKLLFAGGLFPVLECSERDARDIPPFLAETLRRSPAERVAAEALALGQAEAGSQALEAYSWFLTRLDDEEWRNDMSTLPPKEWEKSERFQEMKAMGKVFETGLSDMLFTSRLQPLVRDYLVF